MLDRFTEDGRAIVSAAQDEARSLGHEHIGTQHLLLALLRDSEGMLARALESFEVTYDEVRDQVVQVVGEGGEGGETAGELPLTPRARRALEGASNEAVELEHERAGPEHILLSLVMDPTSLSARLLREFEVGPGDIRPAVLRLLRGTGPLHFQRVVTRGRPPSTSWEEHYEDVDDSWTGRAGKPSSKSRRATGSGRCSSPSRSPRSASPSESSSAVPSSGAERRSAPSTGVRARSAPSPLLSPSGSSTASAPLDG